MLTFQGGNLRTRVTGDTQPIRLTQTDASGNVVDITDYSFRLVVDPNENPESSATNLFEVSGSIVSATGGVFEFALTDEQAALLVRRDGDAAYYAWITVTDASGRSSTARMRLPVAGGPGDGVMSITGLGGIALTEGQVITGEENLRAIVISNGIAKVTYEAPSPTGQMGSHHLYLRNADGEWDRIMSQQYADYFYYVRTLAATASRATVVEVSAAAIEVVFQWDSFSIAAANLDQITALGQLIYPQSSASTRKHSTIILKKRVRMQIGLPGYFVGVDSEPAVYPGSSVVALFVEENNFGEQECGLGTGSAVTRSSAGVTARHPAAGTHVNMGLGAQAVGPWWMLSIPGDVGVPYCRVLVARGPLSSRSYQFGAGDLGVAVIRHLYQVYGPHGAYRYSIFVGALPHEADASSSFANEPSAEIQASVVALATDLAWPA
jgi:hypothetical protein